MKPDLRRTWVAALAVVLATVGCSGQGSSPAAEQPVVRASTQAAAPASAYTGPDEFTLRERFLPVLATQQEAAEHGLADVTWLGEPAFQYRQSMNNTMVASLHVTGTTSASAERADAWLQHANEGLAAHGFVPAAALTQDAGRGLLLTSPNPDADACFTARWGQGSVALTVEVGATDVDCGWVPAAR